MDRDWSGTQGHLGRWGKIDRGTLLFLYTLRLAWCKDASRCLLKVDLLFFR